jgi:hypothetical protein
MKTQILALSVLALGLASIAIPVAAQSAGQYDPSMEKRADRRLAYLAAQKQAAAAQSSGAHTNGKSATVRLHRTHGKAAAMPGGPKPVDRSHLVDYVSVSAKRADLRLRSAQVGEKQAYADWLSRR